METFDAVTITYIVSFLRMQKDKSKWVSHVYWKVVVRGEIEINFDDTWNYVILW